MKNKGIILLVMLVVGVALIFAFAKKDDSHKVRATVGLDAPLFELSDIEGKTWRLSDLRGKVVLLNFWATWCPACSEEKPYIMDIINANKGNDKFAFISVLFKDEPSRALKYMQENDYKFPVLIDERLDIANKYGVRSLPESFIIDKEGVIAKKIIGGIHWNLSDNVALINQLMGK